MFNTCFVHVGCFGSSTCRCPSAWRLGTLGVVCASSVSLFRRLLCVFLPLSLLLSCSLLWTIDCSRSGRCAHTACGATPTAVLVLLRVGEGLLPLHTVLSGRVEDGAYYTYTSEIIHLVQERVLLFRSAISKWPIDKERCTQQPDSQRQETKVTLQCHDVCIPSCPGNGGWHPSSFLFFL